MTALPLRDPTVPTSDPHTSLPGRFYALLAGIAEDQQVDHGYRRQAMGLLQSIAQRLQRIASATAATTNLHATDLFVLSLLYRAGPDRRSKVSVIQRGLGLTAGGMTRRLASMEAAGLVRRLPDPDDGRALLVELTPRGAVLAQDLLGRSDARNRRLHEEFSLAEWRTMVDLLGRLERALATDA